jgi:hypothetical protein
MVLSAKEYLGFGRDDADCEREEDDREGEEERVAETRVVESV